MATFLVAHGAWSAGWSWKKMHPLMQAAGHRLITPTYTGLGERGHLANPSIDLDTHIQDLLEVIRFEGLDNFVLIGHSYGGMVATGVADRASERITQLIYLDAFVPEDGQSLFDLVSAANREEMLERARNTGDGWRIAPNPMPPDTPEPDREWAAPLRLPQPVSTVQQPIRLRHKSPPVPRTYIYCTRSDIFKRFADQARHDSSWRYFELDASHNPHITAPEALAALLDEIVSTDAGE